GLLALLYQHVKAHLYTLALISGNARQEKLYRHLGFAPFGPLVGKSPVQFQPMYLTLETFEQKSKAFLLLPAPPAEPVSFLPGPVSIHPDVAATLTRLPVSHRSDAFHSDFLAVRELLCQFVQARQAQILLGSGTLANDVIAGQLSLEQSPGLIL